MTSTDRPLRRCWHPVAYASALGERPLATRLLDTALVLWREASGAVRAMDDRCVHRGTALSLGRVESNEIVCPYHGWRFGGDGVCTRIPQLDDPMRVPPKARITAYRAMERHGLVWVALDAPRWDVPAIPEFDLAAQPDSGWVRIETGPFAWNCDASRQLENFTDFGHFAWVHPGLLGDPAKPQVAPYEVTLDGPVVRYACGRPDVRNTEALPVFTDDDRKDETRRTRYSIHVPYTLVEHIDWGGRDTLVYLFVSQPVSETRCIGYCQVARNYNLDQSASVMQAFEDTIFEQDRRIVESQTPAAVPFDAAAELHLRFDAVAMHWRRAMRENGLA